MNANWVVAPPAPKAFFDALPDLHPLTVQTLHARGIHIPTEARAFLNAEVPRVDPFLLKDMPRAVERIMSAIGNGEKIAVYGDYDCDGVSACALLMTTLRALGAGDNATCYIPDRFEEGYGLNSAALDKLKSQGVGLVITVDCGVRAVKEAEHAWTIGLELIITDHHELEHNTLPDALAVINPNRFDCPYPFKKLAGVGVAFRLAQCLLRQHREHTGVQAVAERALLDFVALGTVADIVPLVGENRALVRAGLAQMRAEPRAGLLALMQAARLAPSTIDAGKIGFVLGPRLNAAGRLEHARTAYDLLMTDEAAQAEVLAYQLNLQNEQRQSVTQQMTLDAERLALDKLATDVDSSSTTPQTSSFPPALLFAASAEYNSGVVGLAAARLMEKHCRPAVVVSINTESGEARGSCRSVHGFHITDALDECAELLLRHGGHAAAAGFTARTDRLPALHARLLMMARMSAPATGWQRSIKVDGEVLLGAINWKAQRELEMLEPHGMENARPVFAAHGIRVLGAQRLGKAEANTAGPHLKLKLRDERGAAWDALMWRAGERLDSVPPGSVIDIAFQLEASQWQGEQRLQLVLKDIAVPAR